jgi:hypothetical protein
LYPALEDATHGRNLDVLEDAQDLKSCACLQAVQESFFRYRRPEKAEKIQDLHKTLGSVSQGLIKDILQPL